MFYYVSIKNKELDDKYDKIKQESMELSKLSSISVKNAVLNIKLLIDNWDRLRSHYLNEIEYFEKNDVKEKEIKLLEGNVDVCDEQIEKLEHSFFKATGCHHLEDFQIDLIKNYKRDN